METLHPRRNPLSPAQERARKKEFEKSKGKQIDRVYAMAYRDKDDVEKYFYVGIAVEYEARWNSHRRAITLGLDPKPAYEMCRHLGDRWYFVELDPQGEFTEAEWIAMLEEQGHPLTNVAGGVDVRRKKRETSVVTQALKRVNDANAEYAERRDPALRAELDRKTAQFRERVDAWARELLASKGEGRKSYAAEVLDDLKGRASKP